MLYRYEALDTNGKSAVGTTEAGSAPDARASLLDRGLIAYVVEDASPASGRRGSPGRGRVSWLSFSGRRLDGLTQSTRHLALLLRTGLPLAQALSALAGQIEDRGFRTVIEDVACRVREGFSFDEALSSHPRYFPELYVHVVRAGAQAGELAKVLVELAAYYTRQKKIRDRVVSALTYPALMCAVGVLVLIFLLSFVVPKVTAVLLEEGRVLPWPTEVLLFVSGTVSEGWPILIPVFLAAGVLFWRIVSTRIGRRAVDRVLLLLPIIGELHRKQAVARWAGTMSTLLKSGIPVAQALSVCRGTAGSVALAEDVARIEEEIVGGRSLSDAIKDSRLLPSTLGFVVGVGEESGELDQVLREVADSYNEEVEVTSGRLTDLLNPVLIVFLGLVVGFIVAGILLPITDFSQIQ